MTKKMSYKPTDGMINEARRGLDWRSEHGRGGTAIGMAIPAMVELLGRFGAETQVLVGVRRL